MKKIPMLFTMVFDDNGNRVIIDEVNEKAKFLLDHDDAVPTFKKDGTAAKFDGENWFMRRAVKEGKTAPEGFIAEEYDKNTGRTFGWEPAAISSFKKMLTKAIANHDGDFAIGTYELTSPKINGNPENVTEDTLMAHGADIVPDFPTITEIIAHENNLLDFLKPFFAEFKENDIEGIVWWVNNAPAVKLRVKDFFPDMDSRFKK